MSHEDFEQLNLIKDKKFNKLKLFRSLKEYEKVAQFKLTNNL